MGNRVTTVILVGMLSAMPVVGFAKAPAAAAQAQKQPSKTSVANHATTGVVKSIDETNLVISRSGKNKGDMTFVLNPTTERSGSIEVGSTVSVRYQQEGQTYTASAITAQHTKQQAAHKAPSGK